MECLTCRAEGDIIVVGKCMSQTSLAKPAYDVIINVLARRNLDGSGTNYFRVVNATYDGQAPTIPAVATREVGIYRFD